MPAALAEFLAGYLEAAGWADGPEQTPPDPDLFDAESQRRAFRTCADFLGEQWPTLEGAAAVQEWRDLGRDLWLTGQGHGTGYWDRGELPEDVRDTLTEAAQSQPQGYVYATHEGRELGDEDGPGQYVEGCILHLE
jgi:hypothetical protein